MEKKIQVGERIKVNNLKVIWVQSVFTPTLGHAAVTYREIYDFVAYAMRACEFRVRRVRLGLLFLVGSGEQNARDQAVSFADAATSAKSLGEGWSCRG